MVSLELEKPRLQNRTPWLTELCSLPALACTCFQFLLPYPPLPGSLLRPQDGTLAKSTLEEERDCEEVHTALFPTGAGCTLGPPKQAIQSPWKPILEHLVYSLMTLFQPDSKSKLPWDKA